ncbi:BLUF domain-containing protein [Kordiimonas sp. SCSIO 12610]|uniref:BLUF domain-containing protein n=1 Tax=Kordiimonas sp. SCSIO 12610 TaxID=2829597 RepID=UPI00210F1FC8|nr:BLUF domain-containing protein [Kordiimonas sp. SCSIO 12610]UTW56024.1 BLUF domain-containing protein [Kordiimonas sp. SCSIO 12610]
MTEVTNNIGNLYCITYMSHYCGVAIEKDMDDILKRARKNNKRRNVTGILLADNGVFMQVIEGEKEAVKECFDSICKDPRHSKIECLRNETISIRTFDDWDMAFVPFENLGDFQRKNFIHLRDLVISKKMTNLFKDPHTSLYVRNFFSTIVVA